MNKKFILAMALILVLAFAGSAFAAQITYSPTLEEQATSNAVFDEATGQYVYGFSISTSKSINYTSSSPIYTSTGNVYAPSDKTGRLKFRPDGVSNYPYEIYLPNEITPASYRIHTSYSKNTDACASCHSTHTAVGESLLQWYTVYDTCMACHDGTVTTTYNVAAGYVNGAGGKRTAGGMFGVANYAGDGKTGGPYATQAGTYEAGLSSHNVTGAVQIAAAPGGSVVAVSQDVGKHTGEEAETRWAKEFGCESCHTPHGLGGNARILNPDPNWTAAAIAPSTGYFVVANKVYNTATPSATDKPLYLLKGYPYSNTFYNGADKTTTPTIDNTAGYSVISGTADKVYGIASIKVVMNIAGYLTQNEAVSYTSGMNVFCGACHTDYENYASGSDLSGTYSKAHRHKVGFDQSRKAATLTAGNMPLENGNLQCLTCHFAHGTSSDFWLDTLSVTTGEYAGVTDPDVYVELAGSSALKRQPNMGVCETCHDKSDGNQGYAANANGGVAIGLPVDAVEGDFFGQANATFVGMNNTTAPCGKCHREATEKLLDTQHPYLVSPLNPADYFTVFNEETGTGNANQDAFDALDDFKTAYTPAVMKSFINAYATSKGATADAALLTATEDEDNVLSAGQVPIGSRTEAAREIVVRTVNGASYSYTVIATVEFKGGVWDTNPTTVELAAYKPVALNAGYASCFTCHASLVQTGTSNDKSTALLDSWTKYWDLDTSKPKTDIGVTCEACHGEGSNHVQVPSDDNIYNPAKDKLVSQDRVCGRCHVSSGNKNGYFLEYSPWKLADQTTATGSAIVDVYDANLTYSYNTVATKMDAYFKAGYEWPAANLAVEDFTTASVSNWSYWTKDGRRYDSANHSEYTEFALNGGSHFAKRVSCSGCHDSHEDKYAGQLKQAPQQLCGTCHGTAMIIEEVMPKNYSGVVQHDFLKVYDENTKQYKNSAMTGATSPIYRPLQTDPAWATFVLP